MVIAVTAILATIGVGTIYAPYFADRDKLRGLHEEADGGLSERERREFEQYMRQIQAQQHQQGAGAGNEQKTPPMGNSMWNRMQQASKDKKE